MTDDRVQKSFRFAPDVAEAIDRMAHEAGISQTMIVESAVRAAASRPPSVVLARLEALIADEVARQKSDAP